VKYWILTASQAALIFNPRGQRVGWQEAHSRPERSRRTFYTAIDYAHIVPMLFREREVEINSFSIDPEPIVP
jgi:hypothetical protein